MERENIKKIYFSGMMLYLLMLLVSTTYSWLDGSKYIFVLSCVLIFQGIIGLSQGNEKLFEIV